LVFLLLATAYGLVVGASISMYYDTLPNMGALEDNLANVQPLFYFLAVSASLIQLPLALSAARHKLWKQAAIRAVVGLGPWVVFLGADGLIAHFLWWSPISDTDRFHMLHHSLFAGVPLTLGYWLGLRWWWKPETFSPTTAISRRAVLVSGVALMILLIAMGILMGGLSPITVGLAALMGLLMLFVWRAIG
jgi:hypothetical protein